MRIARWIALCAGLSGCGSSAFEWPVIDVGAWQLLPPQDDPFDAFRATDEACPPTGYAQETGYFEVETDVCAFATFAQPIVEELEPGDVLTGVLWHLDLWAPEPAEATVVVAVGDQVLLEKTLDVPSQEGVYPLEWVVDADIPAGDLALLHIRNHGYNSWRLGPISAAGVRRVAPATALQSGHE